MRRALLVAAMLVVGCETKQEADQPKADAPVVVKEEKKEAPTVSAAAETPQPTTQNVGVMKIVGDAAPDRAGNMMDARQASAPGKGNTFGPGGLGPEIHNALGGLGASGVGAGGGGISAGIGTKGRGSGSANGVAVGHAFGGIASGASGYGMGQGMLGKRGIARGDSQSSGEGYHDYGVNPWVTAAEDHLSTFAVDVDTGSYTLARNKLLNGQLPPPEAIRVEEFTNYFRYQYPAPTEGALGVTMTAAPSPFSSDKHLLRVAVQGKRLAMHERKASHLTFLVDVSGSMQSADKLPLAKRALRMLVDNLRDGDTVALVTYASGVRLVLQPTGMEKKAQIHAAIEDLQAGGSTAMSGGIELAYQVALKAVRPDSNSRVIILSDGDANVGARGHAEILKLVKGAVSEGVTCTTVGFGMGNYQDELMEQFANKGNGTHHYIDSLFEARRLFQEQLGSTLEVIAQDVKLQVDFDAKQVKSYRLIGYENRDVADRDFRNDKVDAGEIGSGHTVTALYEVQLLPGAGEGLATVRVRAKKPRGVEAAETAYPFKASALLTDFANADQDFRFATAVVGAAEMMRQSPHAKDWSYATVEQLAKSASGGKAERLEFVTLLGQARALVTQVATR